MVMKEHFYIVHGNFDGNTIPPEKSQQQRAAQNAEVKIVGICDEF